MKNQVLRRRVLLGSIPLLFALTIFVLPRIAHLQAIDDVPASSTKKAAKEPTGKHVNFEEPRLLDLGTDAAAAQPIALVTADFDSDGFADVVTADSSGGLQLLKGIDPANFAIDPNTGQAARPAPFSAAATGASLCISPDFLFAGDFNADGHSDILGAAKGATEVVVVLGDGFGHFSRPVNLGTGGSITAIESGEIGRADGQADVAVTFSNKNGNFLAVYEHPESAFKHPPEIIKLPSLPTSIAIGNMDEDFYSDIAVACGSSLVIIHERGQAYPWDILKDSGITRPPAIVETRLMPFSIAAMTVGRFGEKRGTSLGMLGDDGNIYELAIPEALSPGTKVSSKLAASLNAAPFEPADNNGHLLATTFQDWKTVEGIDAYGNTISDTKSRKDSDQLLANRAANEPAPKFDLDEVNRRNAADAPRRAVMKQRTRDAFVTGISAKTSSIASWNVRPITSDGQFAALSATNARLTRASVSDSPFEDLIVTSPISGQAAIVLQPRGAHTRLSVENITINGDAGILALLPMRLNLDGISDLITLRQGSAAPSVLMSAPSATFSVNTTDDDGDCNFGPSCSLRDAIRRANQIGGSSTIYFNISDTPSTISPLTPLPALLQPITIQGSHQPDGTKRIEINGQMAGTSVDGLRIRTSNSFIYDLAITGFKSQTINGSQVGGNGIAIESDSARPNNAHNTVLECYVGIDASGTTANGNMAAGVLIFDSDDNDVSGSTLSGNNAGIAVEGGNTNVFANNILGLNSAGSAKVANFQGVFLGGANNTVGGDYAGAPNTISGNGVASNIAPCVGYGVTVPVFVDAVTNELLSHDNSIVGNRIGTDPGGGVGLGNCWQGINVHPLTGTTIGSIAESGRNTISGNGWGGVYCEAQELYGGGTPTEGGFCSIMGNNIGTDISGSYSIYNDKTNITQTSGDSGAVAVLTNVSLAAVGGPGGTTPGGACTGFCNLISGNSGGFDLDAAVLTGGPGIAGVFNNYIGTKRNGTQVLENGRSGIELASTTVAGAEPAYYAGGYTELDGSLGNLISGNNNVGITVGNGFPGEYHVLGNLIGTDVFGEVALQNGSGVFIRTGFSNLVDIGDSNQLGRNVIAGNAFNGINLFSGFGVKIVNNAIGVNGSLAPLGNGGTGVNVGGYFAFSTIVGGTDSSTANFISNNGKSGVKVNGITSTFNVIRGNVIHNNGQLGIDLNQAGYFPDGDGVTPNDDCEKDADLGANRLQNFPVLFTPGYNPDGTVHVTGTLISEPFHHFRIDVYATLVPDPSGHGEGQLFLGTAEVTVDGNGFGTIDWNSIGTAPNGAYISATATDDLGNTSEFSCNAGQSCDGNAAYKDLAEFMTSAPLTCPASIIVNIDTDQPDVPGDNVCDVDTSNGTLDCSLRAAIELVNNPSYSGPHDIKFDIPGAGIHTVTPSTPLPAITRTIYIRANTQPGWTADGGPVIELSGVNQAAGGALTLAGGSDGSTISGFTINRFVGDGIVINSNSNAIESCAIGLNAAGTGIYTNRQSPNGITITGNSNTIGGAIGGLSNHITGNAQNQVLITGSSATRNNVFGNAIGWDRAGTIYAGLFSGVRVDAGATENHIGGTEQTQYNDIRGAKHAGVEIVDGANGNFVLYNIIKRGYAGVAIIRSINNTVGIPDQSDPSVHIVQSVDNIIGIHIGDETPQYPTALNNAASKADGFKILPSRAMDTPLDQVQTRSNKVYSSGFGSHDLNQSYVGVFLGTTTLNEIGRRGRLADGEGAGNVIDGNDFGVWISSGAIKNSVKSNTIGHASARNRNGILIQGKENTIEKNVITENSENGIVFAHISDTDFPSKNKVIRNNIGILQGNSAGNGIHGIVLDGQDNDIGMVGQGNIISGNFNGCGIKIEENGDANRISGNAIGLNADAVAVPNEDGICILGGLNRIVDNFISGNTRRGVSIGRFPGSGSPPPRFNVLLGNHIGTNFAGEEAVPNGLDGILLTEGAIQNKIGGPGAGEGNLISGNRDEGILIGLPGQITAPSLNEIVGNRIGTNAAGDRAIPNEKAGIVIFQSQGNTVGGYGDDIPGARNVISGNNLVGVILSGAGTYQNRVSGNYIGVGSNGTQPIGNGHNGVHIALGAHDNIIGGTEPNAGNIIANNGRNGIALAPDAGTGNLIDPNSIFANTMLGITLNETADPDDANGPPPASVMNDPGDADTGPNNLQNYPQINLWQIDVNGDLLINYKVDSLAANSNYGASGIYVEFFEADLSGEGERFIGSNNWTLADLANGGKVINLGNAAALGIVQGDLITASATDADGNTSEFFPPFAPSAASVSVGGRIVEPNGNPIGNAMLTLTDTAGHVRRARSSAFGSYRFDDVEVGQTYVLAVSHKRYTFSNPTRLISVVDELTDVDFTSDP